MVGPWAGSVSTKLPHQEIMAVAPRAAGGEARPARPMLPSEPKPWEEKRLKSPA